MTELGMGIGILIGAIVAMVYFLIIDYFTLWRKFIKLHKEKVLETRKGTYTFTPKEISK
jgi:hypothetical protein